MTDQSKAWPIEGTKKPKRNRLPAHKQIADERHRYH